jgi:hypothetical protein
VRSDVGQSIAFVMDTTIDSMRKSMVHRMFELLAIEKEMSKRCSLTGVTHSHVVLPAGSVIEENR